MINSRVELLFKNLPDKYPHQLEQNHLRILNRLMQIWDLPEFDSYMHDLMIIKRTNRQGFSAKVVTELMFLNELHDIFRSKKYRLPEIPDSWKGIPVSNPTPQGFHLAIELGQLDVVEAFLKAGVKVDYRFDDTQTPLMVAVISGQLGVVRFLIEYGAEVSLRDAGKYTALHWAAYYGRNQIIEVLIDADAEINATQNSGATPLSLAVTRGRMDVARLLLEHQADPNIDGNLDLSVVFESDKKKQANKSENLKPESPEGWSNIDPEKNDNLNTSSTGEGQSGRVDKPALLMNPRQKYFGWPWDRIDALIFSAFFVFAVIVLHVFQNYQKRAAIAQNQNQAVGSNSVVPAPPIVARQNLPDTNLLPSNQSSNRPNKHVSRNQAKSSGTAVNPVTAYTFDDLINAVWHSDTNGVDRLLEQGMVINQRDGSGSTPLIVAVENNDLNMVKHLLAKGADPNMPRQHDGYSPIVIAKTASRPNAELIDLLKASGAANPFDQSANSIRH